MRSRLSFGLACALAWLTLGCASQFDTQAPSRFDSNVFPIAEDRFIIKYHGDPGMNSGVIRQHLLYRAAELTLSRGFGYFTLQDSNSMAGEFAAPSLYGSASDAIGPSASHLSNADRLDPCGPEMERGGGLTTLYSSTAVVRLLKEPRGRGRVFDATVLVREAQARRKEVQAANR